MSLNLSVRKTTFKPAKPTLTEKNLPDQTGKVFMVTGGSGGLGKLLTGILYQRNGKVYIAARSEARTREVINELKGKYPASKGELVFLPLDLDDLTTIKRTAEIFISQESRLDVLWNNAGVMVPPQGSKTKQGYELQYGVNNLGHFLLTSFLRPVLEHTASTVGHGSVRVIWVSSSAADGAPNPAIDFSNMDYHKEEGIWQKYGRSKAASVIHSAEFARRTAGTGIFSLVRPGPPRPPSPLCALFCIPPGMILPGFCETNRYPRLALNPGNFVTNLQQNMPKMQLAMFKLITSEPINGAYTELFAGLSPEITETHNGGWVSPFGKIEPARKDLVEPEIGRKFWEWCEAQLKPYM